MTAPEDLDDDGQELADLDDAAAMHETRVVLEPADG